MDRGCDRATVGVPQLASDVTILRSVLKVPCITGVYVQFL